MFYLADVGRLADLCRIVEGRVALEDGLSISVLSGMTETYKKMGYLFQLYILAVNLYMHL